MVRCSAILLAAVGASGPPPTEFLIWKQGANATDKGTHLFTARSAQALLAQQEERGNLYSIDVDHLSLNEMAPPESRKAVGWHRLAVRDGELWAVDVEWTDTVRAGLEKDPPEWRYFSPAYAVDKKTQEITGYVNTALTNNPATHNLNALANRVGATAETEPMKFADVMAALMGDDEDKKQAAIKAMKAAFGEPDGDEEKKDPPKEEKKDTATTKAAEEPPADEKKKDEDEEPKKDTAVAASKDPAIAELQRLVKEQGEKLAVFTAKEEAAERAALMASHEVAPELATRLAKQPLRIVRDVVTALPTRKTPYNPAASLTVTATRGAGQGGEDSGPAMDPELARSIDARMGLGTQGPAIVHEGRVSTYRPMGREEAVTVLASMAAKNKNQKKSEETSR
jgi:hypothetical protein